MDEPFTIYQFGTDHMPRLEDFTHRGRVRLTVSCACRSRLHALSSGQAKHCPTCGLVMARVGQILTIAKV